MQQQEQEKEGVRMRMVHGGACELYTTSFCKGSEYNLAKDFRSNICDGPLIKVMNSNVLAMLAGMNLGHPV